MGGICRTINNKKIHLKGPLVVLVIIGLVSSKCECDSHVFPDVERTLVTSQTSTCSVSAARLHHHRWQPGEDVSLTASVGVRDKVPTLPIPLGQNVLNLCHICDEKTLWEVNSSSLCCVAIFYSKRCLKDSHFTCLIDAINKLITGNPIINCRTEYTDMKV